MDIELHRAQRAWKNGTVSCEGIWKKGKEVSKGDIRRTNVKGETVASEATRKLETNNWKQLNTGYHDIMQRGSKEFKKPRGHDHIARRRKGII